MCLGVVTLLFAGTARAGETSDHVRIPLTPYVAPTVTEVVVEPGDHLWKISAGRLQVVLGREASNSEISPYWRTVIEENRAGLRSGDPDLIYPGEVIALPPAG